MTVKFPPIYLDFLVDQVLHHVRWVQLPLSQRQSDLVHLSDLPDDIKV